MLSNGLNGQALHLSSVMVTYCADVRAKEKWQRGYALSAGNVWLIVTRLLDRSPSSRHPVGAGSRFHRLERDTGAPGRRRHAALPGQAAISGW